MSNSCHLERTTELPSRTAFSRDMTERLILLGNQLNGRI